jgi:hypothetical protein
MRICTLVVAISIAAALPAVAQQAHTTRIETRPYYGAVVTIEHGVRVYRPIPATDYLIINPDGKTPLSLDIGASTVINQNAQATR